MKKALSILTAVVMLFSALSVGISAKSTKTELLQFNNDGKFKILQIADLQDNQILNRVAKDFIRGALETEKPDLVILTGDNFSGNSTGTNTLKRLDKASAKMAIDQYMSIFEEYGIPVTMVPGNHDDDCILVTKEEELEMYQKYSCFIGYDDAPRGLRLWQS